MIKFLHKPLPNAAQGFIQNALAQAGLAGIGSGHIPLALRRKPIEDRRERPKAGERRMPTFVGVPPGQDCDFLDRLGIPGATRGQDCGFPDRLCGQHGRAVDKTTGKVTIPSETHDVLSKMSSDWMS